MLLNLLIKKSQSNKGENFKSFYFLFIVIIYKICAKIII